MAQGWRGDERVVAAKRELDLGIDPGKEGWITAYDGKRIVGQWPIPWIGSEPDLFKIDKLFAALKKAGATHASLEKQQTMGRESPKGAFVAGGGFWVLKTFLYLHEIKYDEPRPQDWKKAMGLPTANTPLEPLPKKPKKPRVPKRNRTPAHKKALVEWEKAMADWRYESASIEKTRSAQRRAASTKRKNSAIQMAKRLAPGHDFRATERSKKPHDGKCESFLLAVHSRRTRRA